MSLALTECPPPTELAAGAAARGLSIIGSLPVRASDPVPTGTRGLVLLGPGEPGFWSRWRKSPEARDGGPDPMDRWSRRVIGGWAEILGVRALFPFDGPPWLPFVDWARRSGRAWYSPAGFLVHESAGLLMSIRGALAVGWPVPEAPRAEPPCRDCPDQPCLSACPVSAPGGAEGYDLDACHDHLDRPDGQACLHLGCAARRACPVSRRYPRVPAQSAFHMRAFHGTR